SLPTACIYILYRLSSHQTTHMTYLLVNYSLLFLLDTSSTDFYTLSLPDALPISVGRVIWPSPTMPSRMSTRHSRLAAICLTVMEDRKSTRLNSSHVSISYAVFCLKKKKNIHEKHYSRFFL